MTMIKFQTKSAVHNLNLISFVNEQLKDFNVCKTY